MSELDATLSGAQANSYLTKEEADDLMDGYDQVDKWEALAKSDPDRQAQLLRQGTRLIDQYRNYGDRKEKDQRLAFPRATDKDSTGQPVIPDEVKNALLEYVNYRLEKTRVGLKQLQAEHVTNASILGQNTTMETDESQLPAEARKELDSLVQETNPPIVKNHPACGLGDGGPFGW